MRLVYFSPVFAGSYAQRPHFVVQAWLRRGVESVLWVNPHPARLPQWQDLRRRSAAHDQGTPLDPRIATVDVSPWPVDPLPYRQWLGRRLFWRSAWRKLAEFAIVADPHLTTCCENDRGRLYAESEAILRRTVAEINRRPTDFVLVPGDLTHLGSADEVALAREILDELQCPVLMVPGDHDMDGGKHDIYDAFGPGQWVERRDGLTIIGCDMIDIGTDRTGFCLGQAGVEHVLTALESADGPILMLCHRQFVPDDYVPDRSRAIGDHERFVQQVLAKLPPGTIAYVGHKNVAARFRQGNLLQLNVPQPVEYPCGTLRVRCFANGFYHSFVPMFSETLNDVSRVACNALGLRTRTESYKRGRGHGIWNFVWDPTTGRVVA